jgi:proline racemase
MKINPIRVTDMHTGGEPVRIIASGYPDIMKDPFR